MKPRHQVSRAAIDLIKRFEGYRRKAAQLVDGRWTIGYGHTLTAREGAEVSESDAEALLLYDLISVSHAVNEWTFTPLTQNQFDSLCCFAFNIGLENFRRSSALRRVNEGAMLQAACAMEMWRKADFEGERIVIDALVRRRSAEKTLFLTPAAGWIPAPSPVLKPKVDYDAVSAVPRQTPTVVTTDLTGERAVAERDTSQSPRAALASPSLSEVAAERVGARFDNLMAEPAVTAPEPVVAAPAVPEPVAPTQVAEVHTIVGAPIEVAALVEAEPAVPQEAAPELVATSEPEPLPGMPEVKAEEPTAPSPPPPSNLDFPPIPTEDFSAPPPQPPEPVRPAPALSVVNGDRAFALSPPPEDLSAPPVEVAPLELPVAANESAPGLFETPFPSFSPEPEPAPSYSRPLVNEDYVRRLVQEDERASMALELDPEFHEMDIEPGRISGLPWLGGILVGMVGFGGGLVWAVKTHEVMIGYPIALVGIVVGGVCSWQWLRSLGVLNATDEDEEPQDQG